MPRSRWVVKDNELSEPDDLGDGKQSKSVKCKGNKEKINRKISQKRGRKDEKHEPIEPGKINEMEMEEEGEISEQDYEDDVTEAENGNTTVQIFENDETVEMTVGQHEEFLIDEEGEEIDDNDNSQGKRSSKTVKSKVVKPTKPTKTTIEKGESSRCDATQRNKSARDNSTDTGEEDSDNEIVFNVRTSHYNHNECNSNEKLKLSDFSDECEILPTDDEAEEASMMKFARFLEKRGFIRKADYDRDQEDCTPKSYKGNSRTREGKNKSKTNSAYDDAESEVMIYKGAVTLNYQNPQTEMIPENNPNKRNSSSSEDDSLNTSDETIEVLNNTNNQIPALLFQNKCRLEQTEINRQFPTVDEQVLYQQFLDCRLREQREMVAPAPPRIE